MKWPRWIKHKHRERELDEEIEADFAFAIQQRVEAGATQEEAQFAARRAFGNSTRVKEVTRDMWGWASSERLIQDIRHSVRRLRKAPAFTITTVLTLALGIGATTSIFTLVYAVLLKSLAVASPSELYRLGKEARCCMWPAYSQEKEFSLVSTIFTNTSGTTLKGFRSWRAFRRAGRFLA